MKFKKSFQHILIPAILLISFHASAQSPDSKTHATQDSAIAETQDTDIIHQIESFTTLKTDFEKQIAGLSKSGIPAEEYIRLKEDFDKQRKLFAKKRLLSSWDLTRATDFKNGAKFIFDGATDLKDSYFTLLKSAETLDKTLDEKKSLFKKHIDRLKTRPQENAQTQLLRNVLSDTNTLIQSLKKTREEATKVFEPNTLLLEKISRFQESIQNEIDYFKKERFHKTSPAFYEDLYYQKINTGLWDEIAENASSISRWDSESALRHLKMLVPAFILFIVLTAGLFRLERLSSSYHHGQSLFMAAIISFLFIPTLVTDPMPVEIILFWMILMCLLLILVRLIPGDLSEKGDFRVLVVIYTTLSIVDVIGLPVPVYRIVLTAVSASLSYYCFKRLGNLNTAGWTSRLVLRFLAIGFFISAITELLGFHLLAVLLTGGTIKSAFLIFALWNLRYYFLKIITGVLNIDLLQRHSMIKRHGFAIYEKTKLALHLSLTLLTVVALTRIWGFYDTFGEAFEHIWNLGVSFQEKKITTGMLILSIIAFYAIHLASFMLRNLLEDEFYPRRNISAKTGKSMNSLLHYVAWVVSLFLAFFTLGFELQQFAIIAGALSVGVGFGLQNIVNNFVSGLILLFERPIKVGDTLDIDGEWGTVEKVGLRSTVIRSVSKTQMIIPNSEFISKKVSNLTMMDPDFRITIPVGVAYGSNTKLVHDILFQVANRHPMVDQKNPPEIFFMGFGENSLDFEIWFWTNQVNLKRRIISDILFEVDSEFRKNGIEIPLPQRDLHLRSVDEKVLQSLFTGIPQTIPSSKN